MNLSPRQVEVLVAARDGRLIGSAWGSTAYLAPSHDGCGGTVKALRKKGLLPPHDVNQARQPIRPTEEGLRQLRIHLGGGE